MGGRGSGSSLQNRDALRNKLRNIRDQIKTLVNNGSADGTLAPEDVAKFKNLTKQLNETEFQLYKQLSPVVKEEKWKGGDITVLSREDAITVRNDMMKNKQLYLAIQEAARGIEYVDGKTLDTAVDTLYKSNPQSVYRVFSNTRKLLGDKYGSEMTLYRAATSATNKSTLNMTSTRANAEQYRQIYGTKITPVKIKISDILAVNISRSGGYEEFIVLNKKRR